MRNIQSVTLALRVVSRTLCMLGISGIFFFCLASNSYAAGALSLEVKVTEIRTSKGKMGWALFSQKKGFPGDRDKAVQKGYWELNRDPKTNSAVYKIENVPPGEWAVSVYQDEDNDQKLDSNWIGIPKEPVGVSMNPKPRMGPPKFKSALFAFGPAQNNSIEIKLYH